MSEIEVNLRRKYGFQQKDIRDLLIELSKLDKISKNDKVTVKLPEKTSYLAMAIMWVKLSEYKTIPCDKTILYFKKSAKFFDEAHFFERLVVDEQKNPGLFSKKIPFHFDTFRISEDEDGTANKISNIARQSIETTPLGKETRIHIQELVSNAFNHSQAKGEIGCISRFARDSGLFQFCIADQGCGIRESFSRNKKIWGQYFKMKEPDLIEKATEQYVTCNPKNANQYTHGNSGIGLHFLREFCTHHGGHIVIISGNGYYYIDERRVRKSRLTHPWRGTIVHFKTNLNLNEHPDYSSLREGFLEDYNDEQIKFANENPT